VDLIEDHGPALEYDLLTMTHYQLRDVGGALSWGALLHFVQNLPRTSALSRELVPQTETEQWAEGSNVAALLADIFDLLNAFRNEAAVKGTRHSARKSKPYPRPWLKPKKRHIGRGAIPVADFEAWWDGKRRKEA
jgi:hypothetical protein